jgi:hypothetical protein
VLPVITSINSFTDFTGDSIRDFDTNKIELKCLYDKTISDRDRDKYGIGEDITARVYISPLELKVKTNEYRFAPAIMAASAAILVNFQGEQFEVAQIIELEKQIYDGEELSLAIELRLKDKK